MKRPITEKSCKVFFNKELVMTVDRCYAQTSMKEALMMFDPYSSLFETCRFLGKFKPNDILFPGD
jgi:hypothetical protein